MSEEGAPVTLQICISVRWWVAPYLSALGFFANLMGSEPDWGKVESLINRRGLRVTGRVC